jgi:hypothetical protein
MSEGLNLQDCDVVVNYDLHWNPVRLIQRLGRIDRIGTENDRVWAVNFLPETKLDEGLGLQRVLRRRIQEIHDTIGEDAAILDPEEQINEEAMFAIYEQRSDQLTMLEEDQGQLLDVSEAEELMRALRASDPAEYQRIRELRDGIRSARGVFSGVGRFVFCKAGQYQQLYLTDGEGSVLSRDVPAVLGRVKCSPKEPTAVLPKDHNRVVARVLGVFAEEVQQRLAQQRHSVSLTTAQSYVLRELRALYSTLRDAETDLRTQVALLDEAFRRPATAAIRRQLNTLRRNGVVGIPLVRALTDLYHDHGLAERTPEERREHELESEELPRIVCSEAFV